MVVMGYALGSNAVRPLAECAIDLASRRKFDDKRKYAGRLDVLVRELYG